MSSRNIILFFTIILFVAIVNADVDDDYHEYDVNWVKNVIDIEAKNIINECKEKAAEYCADTAGSWGDAVNCVRSFQKYGGNCKDLNLADHKWDD